MKNVTSESIQSLTAALPLLANGDKKFASDLIASYKKYGDLTVKQAPWVGKLIERAANPQPKPVKEQVSVGNFAGVVSLFAKAKEHLKHPKIVLACKETPIILSIAGPLSQNPGSINVVGEGQYPARKWYGRVSPEGAWSPGILNAEWKSALAALLNEFSADPAGVAKKYGNLTGRCCFCNATLSDPRSTAAGFGPICAEHYGLESQWKEAVAVFEDACAAVNAPLPPAAYVDGPGNSPAQEAAAAAAEKAVFGESTCTECGEPFSLCTGPEQCKANQAKKKLCFLCEERPGVVVKAGLPICAECAAELV